MPKNPNTFENGLNTDISDLVLPSNMMRNCKNMRLLDLDGTSYAVTTIRGTQQKFTLTPDYLPVASVQYGEVLYILSGKLPITGTKFERFELGSFPSPNYPAGGSSVNQYAPFQNLDDAAFNVDESVWNIYQGDFVDLSIQPEYDRSANVIITAKNNPPRIVNSGFDTEWNITDRRAGANSNEYTSSSVDEETRLVLRSQQIMNVAYNAVENGGKLQPGNYVYIFKYTTEDFNETDAVNQSGICSVFEGYEANKYAAAVNSETTKRVRLTLSNVDTDFAYLKVYFKYNRGSDSNVGNVYEFTQPIAINDRTTFDFVHDGFEETAEVSADAINLDFSAFNSVSTHTQVQGYLLLGNAKEAVIDYQELASAAQTITMIEWGKIFGSDNPYTDPANIYDFLSHFSAETYAYGIVFVMNDGSLSPVFPTQGYDNINWAGLTTQQQNSIKAKGLFRFNEISYSHFHSSLFKATGKGVRLDISSIPQAVKDKTLGFFFVRAERKPDLISQGIVIPTIRVPSYDFTRDELMNNITNKNYYDHFKDESSYKNYPILDGIIEPWILLDEGPGPGIQDTVVDPANLNIIKAGYMPTIISTAYTIAGFTPDANAQSRLKHLFKWAYYSADYILNEARYITALQRSNLGYKQWNRVKMRSISAGQLTSKYVLGNYNTETSLLYKFDGFNALYGSSAPKAAAIESLDYVPEGTFTTGHDFISALSTRLQGDSGPPIEYIARSFTDAYFGLSILEATKFIGIDQNNDPWMQPYNPTLSGSGVTFGRQCEGPRYNNPDVSQNQAYLISIYPRASGEPIDDINELYDTTDGLSYKQVGDRIAWADAVSPIEIFSGDCYIGEVYKKLNRSGYDDPGAPSDEVSVYSGAFHADNINQGVVFSFIQECEYNPALRLPYLSDIAEPEKRTFFPFKGNGNLNNYRRYRLPETNKTNQGYSETDRPKTFIPVPSNAPFIASTFFTRIIHSERHIPNAFQNGYRSFIGVNHKDYDPAMGEIVRLLTHRDQVFVVLEHGMGLGPVNQRIQTGSDSAGGIFVEPSGVLPPNLGFASREIGAQHGNAIVQTPSSIYGVDKLRKKIWQFRESLIPISDNGFQRLMEVSTLNNIRLGYDPHYHEVIFTTDDWTLCFKEGLEKFTSFYSYKGDHYARRSKEFYSFSSALASFELHNAPVRTIYGNIEDSYVEFVVNPAANETKVYDFLNIISNEIPPVQIDLFTYKVDTYKEDVLNEANMYQHSVIEEGVDFFTQEQRIHLRDRKWVAQIPNVKYIADLIWKKDGRFRNKYVIIRLTYQTDQKVELLSVITDFRISPS